MNNFTSFLPPDIDYKKLQGKTITIGAFDGCHLGHQALLAHVDYAVTFDPIPKDYFSHIHKVLTLRKEKEKLHNKFIFLNFNKALAMLSPEDFMAFIMQVFKPQKIIIGWDFRFGSHHAGDIDLLNRLAKVYGFELAVQEPVKLGEVIIKSTTIRDNIQKGHIERANKYLGYHYYYEALVIHGKALGRTISFPTVNLSIDPKKTLPPPGVYAGYVHIGQKKYQAAISILQKEKIELEGHILDFRGDLYGKEIKMSFVSKVRESMEFPSLEELKKQISLDIQTIRAILNKV